MADPNLLDVLIIGGGFSGLSAARELARLGVRFQLIDSFQTHLGGRAFGYGAHPVKSAPEVRFDHGAQYVGDLQDELMQFIRKEMPEALVNGAAKRKPYPWEVMLLGGKRYCFRADESTFGIPGCPPGMSALDLLGMVILIAEIELIERAIDVREPWRSPQMILDLDKMTVAEWLDRPYVTKTVSDLMRISVEALLSVEPEEISPFYLFWYCACNDGFLNEINDSEGGPQQYWLNTSMSNVAEKYAEPILGSVRRGTRARKIELVDDGVRVDLDDGTTVAAKKVIVAMSPHTASRIEYVPEPPAARRALMSMPMGRTIKCQVYYKSPWWRDSKGHQFDGYVGGANYPVLWVMDNSPEDGNYVLMTFTVGAQADALGPNPTHETIVETVTKALAYLFDDDRALATSEEFIELVSYAWTPAESHVGGGPNTIMTPGSMTGEDAPIRALNEPWDDKVFFASAENALKVAPTSTQTDYDWLGAEHMPEYDAAGNLTNEGPFTTRYSDMREDLGYMNGAIVSGKYAAHRVAKSLGNASYDPSIDGTERISGVRVRKAAPVAPFTEGEIMQLFKKLESEVNTAIAGSAPASWLEMTVRRALVDMGKVEAIDQREDAMDHLREAVVTAAGHVTASARSIITDALEQLDTAIVGARARR